MWYQLKAKLLGNIEKMGVSIHVLLKYSTYTRSIIVGGNYKQIPGSRRT
jgi:hypothetical protein